MSNIYEMYGKVAEQLDREAVAHLCTIDLLRKLKSGEIAMSRLIVSERSWSVLEEIPAVAEEVQSAAPVP